MGKTSLPPGFRFHPTDVELVMYYLKRKVMGRKFDFDAIAEVDIYKCAPWDLPVLSHYPRLPFIRLHDVFNAFERKLDINPVCQINSSFEKENTPLYVILNLHFQDSYVLCKVFQKDGPGPRNGAQYGAPFKEEDWDDDEDVSCMGLVSEGVHSIPVPNLISPVAASSSCLSDSIPPANNVPSPTPENNGVPSEVATVFPEDDIVSMLAMFREDSSLFPNENGENENLGHQPNEIIEALPHSDVIDIYSGLGDLDNIDRLSEGACDFSSSYNEYGYLNQSFLGDNTPFLELHDLDAPLDSPAEAGISEPINTNELYSNQNCYNAGRSSLTVNPGSSQCPFTLPDDFMA
ncbi:hypothetical protein Patl1_27905 [Pistacia atlantica]|uniref:Uncharacterized protein n=1 Tax=Pistacia atlantica TaxID=434234 RepID=A0ACC1BG36_9ROSI|nr:hypothetical protein Patl1_27905 [Pistacia atlantica]